MKKEITIVIILGIVIGTIVAYGAYTAQKALKTQESQTQQQSQDSQTTPPVAEKEHFLTISAPLNESVFDEDNITVSGKTTPNSVIAILAQENEYLFTADADGNFNIEVNLTGGANQITISAFDENGNQAQETLTVVYSTSQI